ncbi:sugar phosphate nucleotidyltransferase [Aeromonas caviae]|uniref:sugar phosphate nucleotidyltransferase n=1 Tax=Aeromonas caviae TaxID=648 RepID=UPI0038CFEEAC
MPVSACECQGATLFAYHVQDPDSYGVLGADGQGRVESIVETPASPASQYAATGIYFYDATASEIARGLHPSPRAELEITDVKSALSGTTESGCLFDWAWFCRAGYRNS